MRLVKEILLGLIAVFSMASCTDDADKIKTTKPLEVVQYTRAERDALNAAEPFGIDLFKKYIEMSDEDNVMLSPLSAMVDLGMLANGTTDETLEEILNVLNFDESTLEDFNSFSNRLLSNLKTIDTSTEIDMANAMYYVSGFPISESYIELLKRNYGAQCFSAGQGSMKSAINSWLSKYLPNIKLKDNQELSEQAYSVINALRFKGVWEELFDKNLTAEYDFTGEGNVVSKVKYLCANRKLRIRQNEYFICASLYFGNGAYYINLYKPNEEKDFNECLEHFVGGESDAFGATELLKVNLRIPKFEIEHQSSLIPTLKELGVNRLFTFGKAELGKISTESSYVKRIDQVLGFSIDEAGVKIESYTQGDGEWVIDNWHPIVEGGDLFFDHPFIFTINDLSSGAILFMGKIGKL